MCTDNPCNLTPEFAMGVCQSHEDAMRHVSAKAVEAGGQVCGESQGEWVYGQGRVPGYRP